MLILYTDKFIGIISYIDVLNRGIPLKIGNDKIFNLGYNETEVVERLNFHSRIFFGKGHGEVVQISN